MLYHQFIQSAIKARLFQLTLLGPGGGPYGPPSTYLAIAPLNHIAQSWKKLVNSYFGHGETICLISYWYLFLLGQERTLKMLIFIFHIVKFGSCRFFRKKWAFWNVPCVLSLKAPPCNSRTLVLIGLMKIGGYLDVCMYIVRTLAHYYMCGL